MAEIPRPDADRDDLDTTQLPPELADPARVANYREIAERECTPDERAKARVQHEEWMRDLGVADPMSAAALRLKDFTTVRLVALLVHAATSIRDEVQASEALAGEDTLRELAEADRNVEIATRLRRLADEAERACTREQLDAAKIEFREWMRNYGEGNALDALAKRLKAAGATIPMRVKQISAWAALAVLDEGRTDRGDVPTMDAPGGDVTTKKDRKKGRRGAKTATGPKKSKRSTTFVKRIGQSVVGFKAGFAPDEDRLLEMLRAAGFNRPPEQIRKDPAWGFTPIDDATGTTTDLPSLPSIGSDPDFIVWGLRRDAKTGCPTLRFRADAERQATAEALAEGKRNATSARIREITENLVDAWYRENRHPVTTLFPVVWQRSTWTLWVHSDNAEAQAKAVELASATLGTLQRLPGLFEGMPTDLAKTNLRSGDGAENGSPDLASDFRVWAVGKDLAGIARVQIGRGGLESLPDAEGQLEFWLDDDITVECVGADKKRQLVKLSKAVREGGVLAMALAGSATVNTARFTLKFGEDRRWSFTLAGQGQPKAWKLPVLTKPDGTPEGLDAAVTERLRCWREGMDLLDVLVTSYRTERVDRGTWRQRLNATQRLVDAEINDALTKFRAAIQIPLFTPDALDALNARNAEAPQSRGRKARAAAAVAEAAGEMP